VGAAAFAFTAAFVTTGAAAAASAAAAAASSALVLRVTYKRSSSTDTAKRYNVSAHEVLQLTCAVFGSVRTIRGTAMC
jgi:hypothetical protein